MADTIKISLELADAAAQKSLSDFITKTDKAEKGFKKLGESGKGTFDEISVGIGKSIGAYEIFEGNLAANVAIKAFEVLKDTAHELFNVFIVEGVHAAQEAQNALNSLNVALGQSGHYSEETSKGFEEFAKSLQKTTTFEDDAIIKNAALIESMAHLDQNGLKRATNAAVQLAAAFDIDLETASKAVAKSADGNVTALQKLGLQFEKSGTNAGTFANALTAIESQLGGTAESKVNTFSGAIAQTKNVFNDLQEEFGKLIISNPAVIAAIGAITKIIETSSDTIANGNQAYKILVGEGFLSLINGAKVVTQAFDIMVSAVRISFNLLLEGTYALVAGVSGALSPFSDTMKEVFNAAVQAGGDARKSVDEVWDKGSLAQVTAALDEVGNAAQAGLNKLKTGAEEATPAIRNSKDAIRELSEEQKRAAQELNNYVLELAKQSSSVKANYDSQLATLQEFYAQQAATDTKSDEANNELKLARENEYYAAKSALLAQSLADEQAKIAASTVSSATKYTADLAAQKKYNTDAAKIATEHARALKKIEDDKVQARRETLATIATLATSGNQTLAVIGKAAGLTQIAIDTPVAVSRAIASAIPYPLNFVAAAAVATAMAAQAAQLAGVQFADGGIVPGSSFTGDRVIANVNSGEMILNSAQQRTLFDIANGRSSDRGGEISSLRAEIRDLAEGMRALASQPIVAQVDGRELFNVTRNQLKSGRAY